MGEHSKALSSYKKAPEIQKQSLPPNHPDMAYLYGNISEVYRNMGEYSKALSFCERVMDIAQRSLQTNRRDCQKWQNDLDILKKKL
jgi:tetratricopeptide (TPR) repeat protein